MNHPFNKYLLSNFCGLGDELDPQKCIYTGGIFTYP